jgi:outer membrane receptor protein involved in Fe transport
MRLIATYLILVMGSLFASANNLVGNLKGSVIDDQTQQPLSGVKISVLEKNIETDNLGRFELSGIPIGNYTVEVEKQGFNSRFIPLSIQANQTTIVPISLTINALQLPEALVKSDRAMSAASSTVLNRLDFQLRPINSAQDMLRNVPGLVTAQHAGGGKAEQIFLRGFDADHGTDVAAFVDEMPVNMPSHGHGQGYLDLHFLIPETVKKVDVQKGTYFAELGDFATAAAIKFTTADRLDNNIAQIELGSVPSQRGFASSRALIMSQIPPLPTKSGQVRKTNKISSYIASEYIFAPSYFESPQDFQRFNIFSKTHFDLSQNAKLNLSLSHFNSSWAASGQVPERAIESGLITRFGAIDNTEGGKTSRQNANLSFRYLLDNQLFEANAYASKYDFLLNSNFTFFLADSVNGDRIQQVDDRFITGLNLKYQKDFGKIQGTIGGGLRHDNIQNALRTAAPKGAVTDFADADLQQTNSFLYAKTVAQLTEKLRAEVGVRLNYLDFSATDNLPTDATRENYSGKNYQTQIAPKLNLTYSFSDNYKLYLNAGKGFHSNDTRAVVQDKNNHRLPNAWGGEVGVQLRPLSKLVLTATVWAMELNNELVFVGDAGTTEDNGASRRVGVELNLRAPLKKWLFFDADVNWARGRLLENNFGALLKEDNLIPLAPTFIATGLRHVSDRAANEAKTVIAKGYSVIDANMIWEKKRYKFGFFIENLLNTDWNEAQFDTESRLKNESAPVSELHFTPGTPFSLKVLFGVKF